MSGLVGKVSRRGAMDLTAARQREQEGPGGRTLTVLEAGPIRPYADGAVVTQAGKNKEAVGHIKEHLGAHQKEEGDCPDCPLSMKGVSASIEMNDDGGTITVKAPSPETVKAVQEWASKPAGACCAKGEHGTKA